MADIYEGIYIFVLVSLCFVVIPVKIDVNDSNDEVPVEIQFQSFVRKYNKTYRYNPSEYEKRFLVFQETFKTINELNVNQKCAKYGITRYADLTKHEFIKLKAPSEDSKIIVRRKKNTNLKTVGKFDISSLKTLPQKIDWRDRGVISPVRSQGSCGACWAYSVIETVEAMVAIKRNESKIVDSLSVQEMIDCSENNFGCVGGNSCSLLNWLQNDNISIVTLNEYPRSVDGWHHSCSKQFLNIEKGIKIRSFDCLK